MNRRDVLVWGIGSAAIGLPRICLAAQPEGFSGFPQLEFFAPGRARLLSRFTYTDPKGMTWSVPKGYVTDGASIPRIAWSAAGGPFDGLYLDAALIHDYYCDTMSRSWQATHLVFFDAMIARGVNQLEALSKYWAVHKFGPRWDNQNRWTSFLRVNVTPRTGASFMLPSIDLVEALAVEVTDTKFLAYQASEMMKAESIISTSTLSIEQVESIEVDRNFDYQAELNVSKAQVSEVASINKDGQLLVPQQFIIDNSLETLTANIGP